MQSFNRLTSPKGDTSFKLLWRTGHGAGLHVSFNPDPKKETVKNELSLS